MEENCNGDVVFWPSIWNPAAALIELFQRAQFTLSLSLSSGLTTTNPASNLLWKEPGKGPEGFFAQMNRFHILLWAPEIQIENMSLH